MYRMTRYTSLSKYVIIILHFISTGVLTLVPALGSQGNHTVGGSATAVAAALLLQESDGGMCDATRCTQW